MAVTRMEMALLCGCWWGVAAFDTVLVPIPVFLSFPSHPAAGNWNERVRSCPRERIPFGRGGSEAGGERVTGDTERCVPSSAPFALSARLPRALELGIVTVPWSSGLSLYPAGVVIVPWSLELSPCPAGGVTEPWSLGLSPCPAGAVTMPWSSG